MQFLLETADPSFYDEDERTIVQRQERYIRPTEYRGGNEAFQALYESGNGVEHFYLHTSPSLEHYRDLFLKKTSNNKYEHDEKRIIWLKSWTSFISLGAPTQANFFDAFFFCCRVSEERRVSPVFVSSETQEDAICSLKKMFNSLCPSQSHERWANLRILRPHGTTPTFRDGDGGLLETIICQSAFPGCEFYGIEFSAAQCRILATRGNATKLAFKSCSFENNGVSFGQAYTTRTDVSSGPLQLNFDSSIPETLVSDLFNYGSLQSGAIADADSMLTLSLSQIHFDIRSVALTEVRELALSNCWLKDSETSLVESVREGRGPRALRLTIDPLWLGDHTRLSENYLLLIDSLRGNEHLESLHLNAPKDLGWMEALCAALRGNNKLTTLLYESCSHGEEWPRLLSAVATHPTLRCLRLSCDCNPSHGGVDLTQYLVQMIRKNHNLEDVRIDGLTCDLQVVAKCLECNELSKRSKEIKKVQVESTRAGILAEALSQVNHNNPSLIFVLLSDHLDQIALCTAGKQTNSMSDMRMRSCPS